MRYDKMHILKHMKLDFKLAKEKENDKFLKIIMREIMSFLLKYININRIESILITGSLANGEGTVISNKEYTFTSDFDFVIYLTPLYYIQKKTIFHTLSKIMSEQLYKRKIDTHINFQPSIKIFHSNIFPTKSRIYEYEFAHASKCILGKAPSFNTEIRPSKIDALELVFTVISELLFTKHKNISKIEESYIYTKRSLTLLNSLLIFYGYSAKTYEKRLHIAKSQGSKKIIPIDDLDLEKLELYNNLKLYGSFQNILNSLGFSKIDDLIIFQKNFLKQLTMKILCFELTSLYNTSERINAHYNKDLKDSKHNFVLLLNEHIHNSKMRTTSYLMGIALYILSIILHNRDRMEIFHPLIFHKKPPKLILNVIITLIFIYEYNMYADILLNKYFPKIRYNCNNMKEIYYMYLKAERYVKLY